MSKAQPLRTRLYRTMIYVAAILLVLLAMVVSVARVMLHDLGKYRNLVEQQVSQLLDQKVSIQGFDARLEGITPVLIFKQVELLHSKTGKRLAGFEEARVGLAVLASLRERQLVPGEITIDGIDIVLTRHKNNALSIQGFKVGQGETSEQLTGDNQLAQWLFGYSDLRLENSAISWHDDLLGKHYRFNDVNLQLNNRGDRHILAGQLEVPKVLGREVKFSADITGKTLNPNDWRGTFFLQAYSVNIQQWEQFQPKWNKARLKQGQLDLRLWGVWEQNHMTQLSGELGLYDLVLHEQQSGDVEFKLIAGMFDWQRQQQNWEIKLKNLQLIHQGNVWPKTDATLFHRQQGDESVYQVTTDYLRLEDAHQLVKVFADPSVKLYKMVNGMQPSGDITNLKARFFVQQDTLRDFAITTRFKHLNTSAWERLPAIQGFQGNVRGTLNYGELELTNGFSTLYFPKLFRRAFSLTELKARLLWHRSDYGWMLSSKDISAATAEVKSQANAYLHLPSNGASPYLDLQVKFQDGDARHAGTYYPVGIMSQGLVQWLDQGIVGGDVSFGGAVFSGRLSDFPFRRQQGAFQVQFYADNVELDYQSHWPHLTNARIDATFTGEGMYIKGLQAQLLDKTVSQDVEVSIRDFQQPELEVKAMASGPTKEIFEFLTQSPIAPEGRQFVSSVGMRGSSRLSLELYVPLNKKLAELRPLHYRGDVSLKNNDFLLLDDKVDIRKVDGKIDFDERGLSAKNIEATIFNEPASLSVYTQDFKTARPIQIVAEGKVDTSLLTKRFDISGLDRLSGKAAWQGVFTLPYTQAGQRVSSRLGINSSLQQVGIDLPAPLKKQPGESRDFVMSVEFDEHSPSAMSLQYGEGIQLSLGLKPQKEHMEVVKGALHFGNSMPELPTEQQFKVSGELDGLPVEEWARVFASKSSSRQVQKEQSPPLPVEIAMERLQVILDADEHDMGRQVSDSGINVLPQQWPLLNGNIKQLKINQSTIGNVSLQTERDRYGFRIKEVSLTTPFSTVKANGAWHFRRAHDTYLDLSMTSKDLGQQLTQWGFAAIIKQGVVKDTNMQVRWADSPFGFSFAKVSGVMDAYIENGNIVEVDPGAGRLFGLLSLSALPRRLFLDFTDMNSGFSFDTVRGSFEIKDGNATTDNLAVDSTLAKVVVDGRTGLVEKDYALNVLVIPNISGTAPLPAWVVWGPQVGAVLLFFKQLFGKEFDKSVARAYRVTGPWDKPVIEKIKNPGSESN